MPAGALRAGEPFDGLRASPRRTNGDSRSLGLCAARRDAPRVVRPRIFKVLQAWHSEGWRMRCLPPHHRAWTATASQRDYANTWAACRMHCDRYRVGRCAAHDCLPGRARTAGIVLSHHRPSCMRLPLLIARRRAPASQQTPTGNCSWTRLVCTQPITCRLSARHG